jgi:pyruvate-formate lyase-activating enzyme
MDVADKCKKAELLVILKTNGYAMTDVWKDLCGVADAMNIDYKGKEYHNTIRENIWVASEKCHVEVSVPVCFDAKLDDFDELMEMPRNLPIHLLKIFPANKIIEATSDEKILEMREKFSRYFNYIYVENMFTADGRGYRNTFCHECGRLVASRSSGETQIFAGGECCKSVIK